MKSSETPWKFVLLGGDGKTAAMYMAAAALEGHRLDYFSSMHEVGYLGCFREYHAAIVHDHLQPLSGLELAEYLEKLFQSLPMVLLTEKEEQGYDQKLIPSSVVGRYPASKEAHVVLERAVEVLKQPRKHRSHFLLAVQQS